MLENRFSNVDAWIRFGSWRELRISRVLGVDPHRYFCPIQRLAPRVIDTDAERNLNARLHRGGGLETNVEISVSLSERQAKTEKQKREDLHVFSVGPSAMTSAQRPTPSATNTNDYRGRALKTAS
jgi:hypothetical protein